MKKQDKLSIEWSILRQKAEALLKMETLQSNLHSTEAEVQKLIHELEDHQIELQLQNHELELALSKAQDAITLYDSAPSGYYTLSKEGEIIGLNLTGAKMLGKERTDLLNSRFGFFVSMDTRLIFNHFLDKIFSSTLKQVCEVSISTNQNTPIYLHIEGIISENKEYCYSTALDITKRKQAEEKLRESETTLAEAQRIAHIGSWEWDLISNKVKWSKEMYRIYDINPDTYDGNPESILKVIHPDDIELFNNSMETNILGKSSPTLEYRVIHQDGSIHTIFASGSIEFNQEGYPFRSIGTTQDITEVKKANEEKRKSNEIQNELIKRLTDIREEERANISREIHDQLGQSMTALKLDLNWLQSKIKDPEVTKKLSGMIDIITSTIKEVQRISSELRPGILDDLGLAAAIEWYAEEFEKRSKLQVILDLNEVQTNNGKNDLALFRVLQEALTNVVRHAQAKTVRIALHEINEHIVLDIVDDGIGIAIEKLKSIKSLGLFGMHDRVKQSGGTLDILCDRDSGTKIRICIPTEETINDSLK